MFIILQFYLLFFYGFRVAPRNMFSEPALVEEFSAARFG